MAVALVCAPAALAASSPTVKPAAVTSITQTDATLHGTIDPNGLATTYQFAWGLTSALGNFSPAVAASAGAGTASVSESTKLTGLAPSTTYYYALVAKNSSGTSSTPVETLKTTGNPAPTITTEPATDIGRYVATMVDTINPNNQATTYYFEYGLTDGYGFQTMPKTLATGTTPVFVTQVIAGIAPGTVFHYRLVATHGTVSASYGPDQTFETYPWPRPRTTAIFHVTPRHPAQAPVGLTLTGKVSRPSLMPSTVTCSGKVTVSLYAGSRKLSSQKVSVDSLCAYNATPRIGTLPSSILRPGHTARITVRISFGGTLYQAPATSSKVVTVG
jgi:hypothetical protein